MVLYCFGVGFGDASPYVYTDCFSIVYVAEVATFWERAAHSVDPMFSLYNVYLEI